MRVPWWLLGGAVAAVAVGIGVSSVTLFIQGAAEPVIQLLLRQLVALTICIFMFAAGLAALTDGLGWVFKQLRRLGPPETR